MKFHVMTLFPEMIRQGLGTSITGKAIDQGTIGLNAIDIRDFSHDEKHHHVDDYPYGGGAGMVIGPEPVYDCYQAIKAQIGDASTRIIYMTPQGRVFSQEIAEELSKEEHLIFLCGHYEGIDERVLDEIVTDNLSVGDYVLTGGELPAMVMIDAIARLVPGVLNNDESARYESFQDGLLEYPQYTRPPVFHGQEVPPVLLTGNHAKIDAWRDQKSVERTLLRRPDLFEQKQLNDHGLKLYNEAKHKIYFYQLLRDDAQDWLKELPDKVIQRLMNHEVPLRILDIGYGASTRCSKMIRDGLDYHALDAYREASDEASFSFDLCEPLLDKLSEENGIYDYLIVKQWLCRQFPKEVKKAVKRLSQLLSDKGHAYIEVSYIEPKDRAKAIMPYVLEDGETFIYNQPVDIWKKILGQYFYIKSYGIYTYEQSGKSVIYFNLHKKVKKSL